MNFPLFSMIFSMASTVIVGLMMIVLLVVSDGYNEISQMIWVAVVGLVVSIPIAVVLTKKIGSLGSKKDNSQN